MAKIPGKMLSTPIVLKKVPTPMELPNFMLPYSTVSDWVPKKDSANFESDAFL